MGILEGAANTFGLGGDGPTYNVVPLDGGTQKLIGDAQTRSGRSDAAIAAEANQGVSEAGNQALQSDQSMNQKAAGSAQDPGMLQAIRNQYNQVAGKSINNVVKQNQLHSSFMRAQMMQDSAHAALAQQQVETQNYTAFTQAMNQAEMARSQVLSSVLGVAGMAGGMAMSGGGGGRGRRSMSRQEFGNLGPAGGENIGAGGMMANEGSINTDFVG